MTYSYGLWDLSDTSDYNSILDVSYIRYWEERTLGNHVSFIRIATDFDKAKNL